MAQPGLLLDDRYRLDDRIAAGGMGEVWRGTDLSLRRQVAIKLMRPGYARDEEGLARFRAEARYAGSLVHPNIAMVYDYWEGDPPGQPYLVMELVDGPSLAGLLADGPMNPGQAMDVIAQTAAGLQAAHAAGLVHRDIKPGNLLISPGGRVKITDFGIARADWSATLTGTGLVIGTAAYLAPERVAGAPATPAADLYALGVVGYECLTGERPFDGEPVAVALAHQDRPLPRLPPSVPAEIARLIAELTAKAPGARPGSAGEVAERASRLRGASTGPVTIRPAGLDGGDPPRGRLSLRARAGVALAGVAAIGLGGWLAASALGSPHRAVGTPLRAGRHSAVPSGQASAPPVVASSIAQQPGPGTVATPSASPTAIPAPSPSAPAGTPSPSASPPAPTGSAPAPSPTPSPSVTASP